MPFQQADRLKALPPYLFVEIDRKKRAAIEAGKDVINFGVGDPDLPTHRFIVDAMKQAVDRTVHHRYPPDNGAAGFREGIARFMQRRYGVTVDPATEIHPIIGSKEGIGHLPLALVNPGQTVIFPEPGYPVYRSGTIFAGGKPWVLHLDAEHGFLPDFERIPAGVASDAVLMWLNYPNNPTGAVASLELLERAVAFARKHDLVLAYDAAYNEMYYGEPPPSVLEVRGAKDVAVEFHSVSKSFNMTGWRCGFVAGNAQVVSALARIKANLDSGQFGAIQEACLAAYDGYDRPEVIASRRTYGERMQAMSRGLREVGFSVSEPKATFYIWAGIPKGYTSMQVVSRLIDEAAIVCVPGSGFGASCDGFVRFALTVELPRIQEALRRMRELKW